ncbi:hypothetical protein [Herbidospora mongoliensis]|uniref:hypothetical protein n=1 Tax=Herbidospora mongoliensis TaxID=688067 RepID=UPI000829A12F|nr:hypothetical protein [Herbidospora mongoliensis]
MNPLFADLVDDAGLFPPTSLPMADALARHEADRVAGSRVLTHRFLCLASRLHEITAPRPERIGVIVDDPQVDPGDVDLIEVRLGKPVPLSDARLFVEVTADELDGIDAVAHPHPENGRAGFKIRCGGLTREAFPSPEEVARFITFCTRNGIPFKATAGLHHAVRHYDATLGVWRHGFLNLLLATHAALHEGDPLPILATSDADRLVRLAVAVTEEEAVSTRATMISYGSCSTGQPIADLRELGLIGEDA